MTADKSKWKDKLALITGASSGIGAATARLLARQGLRVALAARRVERLETLATEIEATGGQAEVITADLTQEADRQRLVETYGTADVLVNNAGLGWYGYGAEMPWQTAQELIQVNVMAVVQLSLSFLQRMRQRNAGFIINIGSVAGLIPSQGVAVYSATKSFLDTFTTAIFRELHGSNVHIAVLRAGPVKTEFFDQVAARPGSGHIPVERFGVTPDLVARRIWGLLRRPRRVIYVPGWLSLTPWVETTFGWLMDRLGPLLLKTKSG